jgi:hypothetical protein
MKPIPLSLFAAVAFVFTGMAQTPAIKQANGAVVNQPPPPSAYDCAADGTVVNAVTGEPIARAKVNLTVAGVVYSTTTNGAGAWVLSNAGCAPGQLVITRIGFLQNGSAANGPIQNGPIQRVNLVSGSPVHGLRAAMVPQAVAMGKVLDDQGDPVQGAQITLMRATVALGKLKFQISGSGASNDLGEYRVANLQHGRYVACVHVNQPGPMQGSNRTIPADTCYPGPIEGGAASAMELPAGREAKIDFTLNQVTPVHIRGSVTGEPEGRGVGVNLVPREPNAVPNSNFPNQGRRGEKFDFRVPPGAYMLTADYFEGGKHLTARVPVDAGTSDVDNVVVHLDSGFTVTGNVRMESDSQRPVPQFGMSLQPTENVAGSGQFKWVTGTMTFAFTEMAPGVFRLNAVPPAPFYVKSATLGGQDILNTDVPISQAAGPIEVTLRDDGGSVEGDLVDADGNPAGAGVMLLRNGIRVAGLMPQQNGHYKIQNVAPGDYMLYAWDDPTQVQYAEPDWMRRYGTGGVPVSVTAGQTAQIKLTRQLVPPQ